MLDNSHYLDGIAVESSRISELIARTRQIIATAKDALAEPVPSTFLGRKSFEPFPQEDE